MSSMVENLTIGQVCEMLIINPHTLRYWDRVLELDTKRDNLLNRCYSPDDIEKLKIINHLRNDQHLNYKDIKESLHEHDTITKELSIEALAVNDNMKIFMQLLTTTLENSIDKKLEQRLDSIDKKVDETLNNLNSGFDEINAKNIELKHALELQEEKHYKQLDEKLTKWRDEHAKKKKKSWLDRLLRR